MKKVKGQVVGHIVLSRAGYGSPSDCEVSDLAKGRFHVGEHVAIAVKGDVIAWMEKAALVEELATGVKEAAKKVKDALADLTHKADTKLAETVESSKWNKKGELKA